MYKELNVNTLFEIDKENTIKIGRNATVLDKNTVIGQNYYDFKDDLRFSTGEVFVEFANGLWDVNKLRVEGFICEVKTDVCSKAVKLWSTKENEMITIHLFPKSECRVGNVDNQEVLDIGTVCYDCRHDFIDCICGHF